MKRAVLSFFFWKHGAGSRTRIWLVCAWVCGDQSQDGSIAWFMIDDDIFGVDLVLKN